MNCSTNAFYEWKAFVKCVRSLLFLRACGRAFTALHESNRRGEWIFTLRLWLRLLLYFFCVVIISEEIPSVASLTFRPCSLWAYVIELSWWRGGLTRCKLETGVTDFGTVMINMVPGTWDDLYSFSTFFNFEKGLASRILWSFPSSAALSDWLIKE